MKKRHVILIVVVVLSLCAYFFGPVILLLGAKYYLKHKFDSMSPQARSALYRVPEQTLVIPQKQIGGQSLTINFPRYRITLPKPDSTRMNGHYYVLNYFKYEIGIQEPKSQNELYTNELGQMLKLTNSKNIFEMESYISHITPDNLESQNSMANVTRISALLIMKSFPISTIRPDGHFYIFNRGDMQGFITEIDLSQKKACLVDIFITSRNDFTFLIFETKLNATMDDILDYLSTIQIEPLNNPSTAPSTSSSPATSPAN